MSKFWFITALVLAAALTRLLPHPANFTAITALALFSGAIFRERALLIPFAALLLSDAILGFYPEMWVTYTGFGLAVIFGFFLRTRWRNVVTLGLTTVAASVAFFLLTNFVGWACYSMYPKTFDGMMQSYIAAIPFFKNSLAGDLFYTALLFGGYALAVRKNPALAGKV